MKMTTQQWFWMMEWCKQHRLPPANDYFWKLAEMVYRNNKLR